MLRDFLDRYGFDYEFVVRDRSLQLGCSTRRSKAVLQLSTRSWT